MTEFKWYLTGLCAWYGALGIQLVLFPWLVAVKLNAPADLVGIAQMSIMLPTMLFVLIGGIAADRIDGRTLLMRMHLLSALPPLVLAYCIFAGQFSYWLMIGYAFWMGVNSAFMNPARDAMLNNVVAGGNIQRAVTTATAAQFGVQILGFAAASLADFTGAIPVLLLQSAVVLVGAFTARRLRPAPKTPPKIRQSGLADLADAFSEVWQSPRLTPLLALNLALGVLYLGAFFVLIPLLIRDIHNGTSVDLAIANIAFTIGTIISSVVLIRIGGLQQRGRAFMLSLFAGGCVLTAIGTGLPLWASYCMILIWGLGAGVAMSMGRTILQEEASAHRRARVLSMYQLAIFGGSPIGSLAMGYAASYLGPEVAFLLPGNIMAGIVLCVFLGSKLAIEPEQKQEGSS